VSRRLAVPFALLALLIAVPTASAAVGDLSLLPDPNGCVTDTGTSSNAARTCGTLTGAVPQGVAGAESPDGDSLYVAGANRLDVLSRDPETGAFAPVGCYDGDPTSQTCPSDENDTVAEPNVFQPKGVAAFGDDVYVTTDASSGFYTSTLLVHFRRQPDGTLVREDCLGSNNLSCDPAQGTSGTEVVVTPDGKQVVVGNGFGTIATFDRKGDTGAITPNAACVSPDGSGGCFNPKGAGYQIRHLDVSPDSKQLYVATDTGLAVVDRDPSTGAFSQRAGGCFVVTASTDSNADTYGCHESGGNAAMLDVEATADGKHVYATSHPLGYQAIVGYTRASDGSLTNAQCLTDGSVPDCTYTSAATNVGQLTVAPDVATLYTKDNANHYQGWSVATDGNLTPLSGAKSCADPTGSSGACLAHDLYFNGLPVFTVSPDGQHLDLAGGRYNPNPTYQGLAILTMNREAPPKPDTASPQISITTPPLAKATYTKGQVVKAAYTCTDDVAVKSCSGPVAKGANLPTGTVGTIPFTVTAVDKAGHTTTATHYYDVKAASAPSQPTAPKDTTAPTIAIASPVSGASFTADKAPKASYSCADASGIKTCAGTVANGSKVSTALLVGSLTVVAVDQAGNSATKTVFYSVFPAVGGKLPAELKQAAQPVFDAAKKTPSTSSSTTLAKGLPATIKAPANSDVAGGLIGRDGGGIISRDGSGILSTYGGRIMSDNGLGLVSNTAPVVASGGANVVAAGGLNRLALRRGAGPGVFAKQKAPKLVILATAKKRVTKAGKVKLKLKLSKQGKRLVKRTFARKGLQKVKLGLALGIRRRGVSLPPVIVLKTITIKEPKPRRPKTH
jgi:hypothetical protein